MSVTDVNHIDFESTVKEIANFRANETKGCIGHLIALKVGGKDLKKEFNFKNPMSPAEDVKMVGMITLIQWTGAEGDPLVIIGRVNRDNKAIIKEAIMFNDPTRECEFTFDIYEHETGTTFFKSFHTDGGPIKGTIVKKQCYVNDRAMLDYTQIENYEFKLVIEGEKGDKQALQIDLGGQIKKAMQFGNLIG